METVSVELPASILVGSGQSRQEFVEEARLLLLAKLFELGRISSGKAAEICGMGRVDFLLTMGRLGVPVIQLDEEELKRELEDC